MLHLQRDIKAHRAAAILFLTLWLALWATTEVTWLYEPTGESIGMQPAVFTIHLAAPLVIAFTVGWWQPTLRAGIKTGLLAGALFAAANMAALLVWSAVIIALGRVTAEAQTMSMAEGIFEAAHMSLAYVLVGALLGTVGGLLGAGLSRILRQARDGHGRASPTGLG